MAEELKTMLNDAIGVFDQQVSAAFSIDDAAQIQWRHGEQSFALARLTKGAVFYWPKIELLHPALLTDEQNRAVALRLEAWLFEQIDKTLGPVKALETAELKDIPKAIATSLHETAGIVPRIALKDTIAKLEKEDRAALGKLGVRLGAYTVYQRDMLKPAAMRMKATLWRLWHDRVASTMPLPQDGNVSMTKPENADTGFYAAMGLPIFGKTCVRVDMIERVNSAVFDGAVDGKYTFDPALASTIGVSVEAVQAVLQDLGFPFEETAIGEGADAKQVRLYSLKKAKPKKPFPAKEKSDKPAFKKTVEKRRKAVAKPEKSFGASKTSPKVSHGYNAFAGLAALKGDKQN